MAFVVTEGSLAATDRPNTAPSSYALALPDGSAQDYATIWSSQPQVRTVVSFLARNIGQLAVHHFRRVSDVDRERLADSPTAAVLSRPNPFTTRYRMFDSLVNDIGIYDKAYWAKVKADRGDGAPPAALVRLDPRQVKPEGDSPFSPDAFTITGAKGKRTLPADQVVYFRGYSPKDPRGGSSPIEALRRLLLEEWQATGYREQLWRNAARVSGYLSRPVDAPKWSDPARGRFRNEWQAQYLGDGPQAGGTPILEDGMTFTGASMSPEAAQYMEARKLTREEVAAAYHVPLPMVGILDHATFSNIRELHKQLYQDCLGPWLEMIVEELELQLLPEFPDTQGTYLEFNLAAKMAGSFEEQAAQLSTSVGAPWMTRNEARARQNMPQVEGGDDLVVPLNVLTGGQASPTDSAPPKARRPKGSLPRTAVKAAAAPAQVKRLEEVLAGFFERQGKVIVSALGAEVESAKATRRAGRKAGEPQIDGLFDADRWDGELATDLYSQNTAIVAATAHSVIDELGMDQDEYNEEDTLAWQAANAENVAGAVNGATQRRLIDVVKAAAESDGDTLGMVANLFAVYVTARAPQLARSHATALAGFATTEVGRQSGREATKTWRVRSSKPRKTHARMDGESVGLKDTFSNGAHWPGDNNLDEDERAGCTCDIEIEFAD